MHYGDLYLFFIMTSDEKGAAYAHSHSDAIINQLIRSMVVIVVIILVSTEFYCCYYQLASKIDGGHCRIAVIIVVSTEIKLLFSTSKYLRFQDL